MKPQTQHLLTALAVSALSSSVATASTITVFSDDFEDGNRNGWYKIDDSTSTLSVESASPLLGSANELRLESSDSSNNMQAIVVSFPEVTLANTGDSIELQFAARNVDGGFIDFGFAFGLFDSGATAITADGDFGAALSTLEDQGYFARVDVGTSTVNTAASVDETIDTTTERLRFQGGTSLIASDFGSDGDDTLMFTNNTDFVYTLTITLLDTNNVEVSLANDEDGTDNPITGESTTTPTLSFDTLYFAGRPDSNSTVDYRIDNVLITTNIPEPASAVLVALGGLLITSRRRR